MRNWLRFNVVGFVGIGVQLAALHLFHNWFGWHYLLATALAVETSVLHNYWWHWKWTWRERQTGTTALLRFQCTTGFVSIIGNLCGMKLLADTFGIAVLPANFLSIALLYVFNFVVSDRYVFRLR